MTGNLVEFMKVFFIVFSFSAGILAFRKFMLSYDEEGDVNVTDNIQNTIRPPKKTLVDRKAIADPDLIDYDGMGNQGRFPSAGRK